MKSMNLGSGARIYYSGDMANDEGFGVIVSINRSDYGVILKINMDDGRKFMISPSAFSPEYKGNGSTRFVSEAAYAAWKEAQIKQLTDRLKIS